MLQLDVLFNDLGQIGLAQVLIVLIIGTMNFSSGINSLATVFIAYKPDYRCKVPFFDNKSMIPSLNESVILNLTTPFNYVTESYDRCSRYDYNMSLCPENIQCFNNSYSFTTSCDKGYHYDRNLFSETVVTEFDLVCSNKYLSTLSASMYYAGIAFGSVLFGNLSDRFGRKRCILISYLGVLFCMTGIAFSKSIYLFIIFRFGAAACVFGATDNSFAYTTEILGKKWRAKLCIWFYIAFPLGYLVLVGIAYKWRNYHNIMLVATIFCTPFLFLLLLIPESPRWLFSQNKTKEGIKVVNKIARVNRVQICKKTWSKAKRSTEKIEKENINKKFTILSLFKNSKTAVMTLKIMFLWFVNSAVYYGVALNTEALTGDFFLNNILYGVLEIASYVICALTIDKFGRTFLEGFFLILTGTSFALSLIINSFADGNQTLTTVGVIFVFIAKGGICCSFSVVYNMTAELFPTVVRSNAIGVGSLSARIGGVIAPIILLLQDFASWFPNVIFSVLSISAGLLSLTLPETNGHVMMETIEEAENFYSDKKKRKLFKRTSFYDIEVATSQEETVKL